MVTEPKPPEPELPKCPICGIGRMRPGRLNPKTLALTHSASVRSCTYCGYPIADDGDIRFLRAGPGVGWLRGIIDRVKWLLMKLDSDYKNDTTYFRHNFVSKVEQIFGNLPRPKEWRHHDANERRHLLHRRPVQRSQESPYR